jgi:hypothetical protein
MIVLHAGDPLPKSIFLAGPTPRSDDVPSWRPAAIAILRRLGFDGSVLVPERHDWSALAHYEDQVTWEWEGLNQCSQAFFWVPREMELMPAMTTNVEFGLMAASGKSILARPPDAPKMRYLDTLARRYGAPIFDDLESGVALAVERCSLPFGSWAPG